MMKREREEQPPTQQRSIGIDVIDVAGSPVRELREEMFMVVSLFSYILFPSTFFDLLYFGLFIAEIIIKEGESQKILLNLKTRREVDN